MLIAVQNDAEIAVAVPISKECLTCVREALIKERDRNLGPEIFNPGISVGLSHVIAMIANSLEECDQQKLMATLAR